MRFRVCIPTTRGPVMVQNIGQEDPMVDPVICLNGTPQTLPILSDYRAFVKHGTGVIADMTGHSAYRLDVTDVVDGGSSWQLPVYLAHLLHSRGQLAQPLETAPVIWATGEVRKDLTINAVQDVARKVEAGRTMIDTWQAQAVPIFFLAARDNLQALDTLSTTSGRMKIYAVETVTEAVKKLGLKPPKTSAASASISEAVTPKALPMVRPAPRRRHGLRLLTALFVGGAAGVWFLKPDWINIGRDYLLGSPPPALLARVKDPAGRCDPGETRFVGARADRPSRFVGLPLRNLCSLYVRDAGLAKDAIAIAHDQGTVIALKKTEQGWAVPLPLSLSQNRAYSVHLIRHLPSGQSLDDLREELAGMKGSQPLTTQRIDTLLAAKGWVQSSIQHRLVADRD